VFDWACALRLKRFAGIAPRRRLFIPIDACPRTAQYESSLSQDPYFEYFQARRVEPSWKDTTAQGFYGFGRCLRRRGGRAGTESSLGVLPGPLSGVEEQLKLGGV
jgi:hypothetical protein